MIASSDPLLDRAHQWSAQVSENGNALDRFTTLKGWAIYETIKRRGLSSPSQLQEMQRHLGSLPLDGIGQLADHATRNWNHLLNDLDREEANLEHVQRQARDVFFSVLEALVLIEERGDSEQTANAAQLFNTVIHDLYVFEELADVAAGLTQQSNGPMRLSDLFCTGIAQLFDGQVQPLAQEVEAQDDFVAIDAFLRESAGGKLLSPAALSERLGEVAWWYVKWAAQRIKMTVAARSAELRIAVWNGVDAVPSGGFDGWQVRMGHGRDVQATVIRAGTAVLKLPEQVDPGRFTVQLKDPAQQEWSELFARVRET
jgi:hypothetical protein